MVPSGLSLRLLLGAASLVGASAQLRAQAWDGALTGNQDWLLATNWVGDVIPNAVDATATFGTAFSGNPSGPYWTGQSITVGTLNFTQSSGNVAFGYDGATRATLVLATSSGTPTISVASGGLAYFYALLEGTQGFTKTGGGTLTFRYNGNNHTYTGTVTIAGGILGINQDGSLGNADNDIVFSGNSVLQAAPGSGSGTIALGSGRTLTINSGVTATLGNINATTNLTVNGVITGSGNLLINGSNGLYTLNGANNYTGTTTLRNGGKLTLGAGSALGSGDLILDVTSAGTGNTLTLGGTSQTVARLRTTASATPTAASTSTVTGGSLTLTGDIEHIVGQMYDGSVLDLSGLTAFTVNRSTRNYTFQTGTYLGTTNTNTLRLAAGTNTFTVANLTLGTANESIGTANTALVSLGQANVFNVGATFQVGGYNGAGEVAFAAGLTAPSLKLRAADGTSALPTLLIGDTSSGVRSGHGVLDLSAGTLDAVVGAVVIGRQIAGSSTSPSASSLSMGGGTLVADTMRLSVKTNTGTSTLTSAFTQGGGVARVGTVTLGDSSDPTATSLTRLLPTLNLNGGEFLATSITTAGTVFATNSARTINLNGGVLGTYRSADGATTTDLTVASAGSAAAERISLVLGASGGTLRAESGRTFTLGANTLLAGSGGFAKTGAGTLVLGQDATYSGATAVSAGVLNLRHASGLGATSAGTSVASGAALEIQGGIAVGAESLTLAGSGVSSAGALRNVSGANSWSGSVSLSAATRIASDAGTLTLSGGISGAHDLTLAGAGNLVLSGAVGTGAGSVTKQGAGSVTLSGHNTFSGGVTLSAGTLVIGHLSALGSGVVLLSGGVLDLAGYNPANEIHVAGGSVNGAQNWNGGVLVTGSVGSATLNTLGSGLIRVGDGASVNLAGVTKNLTLDGGSVAAFGDYAGTLTLAAGASLDLDGSGNTPVSTSAGFVVSDGATLSGSGSIGGFTSIDGIHAVGNSPGSQSFASGLSYGSTAVVKFEYTLDALANYGSPSSRGVDFDAINVTGGDLTVAPGAVIDLLVPAGNDFSGVFWDAARSFKFIDVWASGAITGAFAFSAASPSSVAGQGSWSLASSEGGDNGIYLQWAPVPEPSTYGLALGALALAAAALRRRRPSAC